MIIKNAGGALVCIKMSFIAAGDLKEYIKGNLSFDLFWAEFNAAAGKLVETAFQPNVVYPIVVNYKGIILTLTEPYTINSVVGLHHGGQTEIHQISLVDEKKNKKFLNTELLNTGVFVETPLCVIVSALLKKLFALKRQTKSYDNWTMAGKLRSQQMIDSIDTELETFKNHPAISFLFPEIITVVQGGDILIASAAEAPWLNGVDRVQRVDLSAENITLIEDFALKAVDLYKGVYGVADTLVDLQNQLSAFGVLVGVPEKWVKLRNKAIYEGAITTEFRQYLEQYPEQILATFPYYIKHAYGGIDLTGSELASTLYDFSRVLTKFTNRSLKYKAENLFTNIYEMVAVIMKDINKPMKLIDISDFIIYHNIRLGAISFKPTINVPTNMSMNDYNKLRDVSKNLTMPSKLTADFNTGLTKNINGNLELLFDGKIFEFEVIVGSHIVNKEEVVDAILSDRTLGFEAVEMLECIEGLYLACLNTETVPGDLYNLEQGIYKYTIPAAYLNSQLHHGFVVPNFNIYIPGNL